MSFALGAAALSGSIRETRPDYPATPLDDSVDELAGVTYPDGLRWLEGTGSDVRDWDEAQNALTTAHLGSWPELGATRRLLDRLITSRFGGVPREAGGRWFRMGSDAATDHARLEVGPAAGGPWHVLVDPASLRLEGVAHIEWLSPSPDGR